MPGCDLIVMVITSCPTSATGCRRRLFPDGHAGEEAAARGGLAQFGKHFQLGGLASPEQADIVPPSAEHDLYDAPVRHRDYRQRHYNHE